MTKTPTTPNKGLNTALWIAQGLLAAVFAMGAIMKLTTPHAELAESAAWAKDAPELLILFIGIVEALGALGIILPAALRIKPLLTPLAATGFLVIMILAGGVHIFYGEPPIPNIVIGLLAAFVAWGRFKKAPITAR